MSRSQRSTPSSSGIVSRSFFDEPEQERPQAWHDVPETLFRSWSVPRQLEYCARRDRDSAARAYDPEWSAFYAARAARYDVLRQEMS